MRFKDAMREERDKQRELDRGPKTPKKDQQTADQMKEIKREINVNNKVRKLLGTGRSAK